MKKKEMRQRVHDEILFLQTREKFEERMSRKIAEECKSELARAVADGVTLKHTYAVEVLDELQAILGKALK